jgi:hypothetical protein
MVNLTQNLYRRAPGLYGRRNGRVNTSPDYVVFKEILPLALRNRVKASATKSGEKACMQEMMTVIDCMTKYNQDKELCSKEISQ